jgi:ribosome-associated protein
MAANTRCHQVTVLDVRGLSPVTDFFVIATGTSARQMRSVCDDLDELAAEHGYKSLSQSGLEGEQWMLMDFVDVMFHVFSQDARLFYDLEGLWGDAKTVQWEDETASAKQATPTSGQ